MDLGILNRLVTKSEGPQLEFERSTEEFREGLQTVCAFLNGSGSTVVIGNRANSSLTGQEMSDQTLRQMTQAMDGFEPPARIDTDRVQLSSGRNVLIFHVVFYRAGLMEKWGRGTNFKGYSKIELDRLQSAVSNGIDVDATWEKHKNKFGAKKRT